MIATVAGIECKGVGSVQLASVAEELQAEDTAKALAQKNLMQPYSVAQSSTGAGQSSDKCLVVFLSTY